MGNNLKNIFSWIMQQLNALFHINMCEFYYPVLGHSLQKKIWYIEKIKKKHYGNSNRSYYHWNLVLKCRAMFYFVIQYSRFIVWFRIMWLFFSQRVVAMIFYTIWKEFVPIEYKLEWNHVRIISAKLVHIGLVVSEMIKMYNSLRRKATDAKWFAKAQVS
jgi:hypothetical protein